MVSNVVERVEGIERPLLLIGHGHVSVASVNDSCDAIGEYRLTHPVSVRLRFDGFSDFAREADAGAWSRLGSRADRRSGDR